MTPPTIHPSITLDKLDRASYRRNTSLANPGFCLSCGAASNECEPDARELTCRKCGKDTVYSETELVVMLQPDYDVASPKPKYRVRFSTLAGVELGSEPIDGHRLSAFVESTPGTIVSTLQRIKES